VKHIRTRLLTIVLCALACALALTTYGFNVLFARTTSRSANSLLRARASSELGLLTLRGGRLTAAETSDDAVGDSEVWIFSGRRSLERPQERTPLDNVARNLAGGPTRLRDAPGSDIRLLAVPIVIANARRGTLVTGLSLAPYEQAERRALFGSLGLAAVMLVLVGAAVFWLLRSALRPVVQMTKQAAAWSEHDLDRRFALGEAHDELTQLAATLDNLLDRIAASLRHERRFSAELSHELRTPLAKVIAEAELALRRDRDASEYRAALEAMLRNARQVARIVETLVAAAEHEAAAAQGTADAYTVASGAVGDFAALATEGKIALSSQQPPTPLRLGVDSDLAARVLHPLVENACRYARSWARVSMARQGTKITYLVEDDGPGVREEERESIFEPGARGSAGCQSGNGGAGLGLALARRLARSASGDVAATPNGGGGRFVVSLPAA
jgi:signal transduction histidine kinase